MNRIDLRFDSLGKQSRAALVPYITAGHPHPDFTVPVMHALVAAGADVIELGIPFSDVMADGPVIQQACNTALQHGTTLETVLAMVAEFRRGDAHTPVVLMGYMNPLERYGIENAARHAADAGADGMLIVDCPAEESVDTLPALKAAGLHQIFLVAPTTSEARMQRIAADASGFIYFVSLKGVTGAASLDMASLRTPLERIRRYSETPVAVGFGITTPEQAAGVAEVADAVVIGSALVKALDGVQDTGAAAQTAGNFLKDFKLQRLELKT